MVTDLQKASLWKRLSAGLFDLILIAMLAVGMAALLSWAFGYNTHSQNLNDAYNRYEAQYGVEFQMTQEAFDGLSQEQQDRYDEAYAALIADEEVIYHYNMVLNLTLLITTFSILVAVLLLEFVVPLLLKNGQTLGKKIFGVALMRNDGVKVSSVQMFIRTVLGKFTIEIMIPVYIFMMIFFNTIGIIAVAILGAILVGELLSLALSKTNSLIHDSIAGTVAVDMASQMIFDSADEKIEYIKRLHAEQAAQKEY
jgi:uncharacterized RDD family membrane protein YckC